NARPDATVPRATPPATPPAAVPATGTTEPNVAPVAAPVTAAPTTKAPLAPWRRAFVFFFERAYLMAVRQSFSPISRPSYAEVSWKYRCWTSSRQWHFKDAHIAPRIGLKPGRNVPPAKSAILV